MGVTLLTTKMAAGINYTYVTDSSADWSDPTLPNNTYFYDKGDKSPHYKDASGNILEVFGVSSNIYNNDGTLAANRTLNGGNFDLLFTALKTYTNDLAPGSGVDGYTVNINTSGMSGAVSTRIFKVIDTNAGVQRFGINRNGNVIINDSFSLPLSDGTSGQVLATSGAGVAYWADGFTPSAAFIPPIEQSEIRRGVIAVSGSTSTGTYGAVVPALTGSAVAVTFGGTVPLPKLRLLTTVGSTNSQVGIITGSSNAVYRVGKGFRFTGSWIYSDQSAGGTNWFVPNALQFCGLATGLSLLNISSTVTLESKTNIIGLGSDAADTNLQIFHNDATGTATKIDLGPDFPANKTGAVANGEAYELELYNAFGSTDVKYRVRKLSNGIEAVGILATNLPNGADLGPQIVRCSGSTSQNVSIELIQLTAYTRE